MQARIARILTGITFLLIFAGVVMWRAQKVHALSGVHYLVLDMPQPFSAGKLQEVLDKYGPDGWQLVATPRGPAGTNKEDGYLIFRRD